MQKHQGLPESQLIGTIYLCVTAALLWAVITRWGHSLLEGTCAKCCIDYWLEDTQFRENKFYSMQTSTWNYYLKTFPSTFQYSNTFCIPNILLLIYQLFFQLKGKGCNVKYFQHAFCIWCLSRSMLGYNGPTY
jgi:hypothetical protein